MPRGWQRWGFWALVIAGVSPADPRLAVIASGSCDDAELLADVKGLTDSVRQRLGDQAMDQEALIERFGPHTSHSASEIQAQIDSAKIQYYSSETLKARAQVEALLPEISRLAVGTGRWELATRAELLYALILKRSNEPDKAGDAFRRVLRLQPDLQLDPDYYSPSAIADFERARRDIVTAPKARLTVRSNPAGADVYLDGVNVGTTPFNGDYPPGRYQVAVSKEGVASRFHVLDLKQSELIHVDLEFEGLLSTRGVFCLSSGIDERAWVRAAVRIGTLVGVEEVVVARLHRPTPAITWLTTSLVSTVSSEKTTEAGLWVQGPRATEGFDELAAFIAGGRAEGAVVVADPARGAIAPWLPPPVSARSAPVSTASPGKPWRIASYVGWSTAGLAVATAATLLLVNVNDLDALKRYQRPDGSIVGSAPAKDLVRATNARRQVATGLLVGGGIGVISGTIFHFVARKKDERVVEISAALEPSGARAVLAASF